ncbi:uncharacterized protein LOC126891863 [Diabrotica virgifera virgifera]|uniref:Luciferin 4-monooxygenase-like n=1 Tax=Diabrotica virgifera virgifera TaxID=50390 RepID=A0ABM5L3X6_DIAVI|nr:uncharacterized protein LOC126891863 [Diabrotica virgifera virgifera]
MSQGIGLAAQIHQSCCGVRYRGTTTSEMAHYWIEENIIKTEDVNYNFDGLGGIGHVFFEKMKKQGLKIAQILASTGERDTFESLLQRCIRCAIALQKKGIKKGDIVTGCSDNHLDACVPIIASFFIGAIPCSLDPTLSNIELEKLISAVRPKIIFTVRDSLKEIKYFAKKLELKSEIVVFGETSEFTPFSDFVEPQELENDFKPIIIKDHMETAVIYFSSGTSGFPKGICLNHYYYLHHSPLVPQPINNDVDTTRRQFEMKMREGPISFLTYGSLYWNSSGMGLFMSAITGVTRLLCSSFDPQEFWYLVDKYRVFNVFLSPFQVSELVKNGKPTDTNCDTLVRIITGGSALSKEKIFALQELLPETDIIPTYGQTEVGILTSFQVHHKTQRQLYKNNPDIVGIPIRGIWYKVVDPETREILGANQPGELLIKAKTVMNCYYQRDCSNRYDKDGWFRTGDVVKYDEDCNFYVVDRVKEMLKYRGWHIPPAILELELSHHPAVRQSVVIGRKHEEDGDHPMAIVVLENEYKGKVTEEDIAKYIEERVQDKQRLRGGVMFVDSIPLTPSGKVKRNELRDLAEQQYCWRYSKRPSIGNFY